MAENLVAFFEFIGFLFVVLCSTVGAYVWLRWGYCGVMLLWQKRYEFDSAVKHDAESTWIRRHP